MELTRRQFLKRGLLAGVATKFSEKFGGYKLNIVILRWNGIDKVRNIHR
jgi:hypothetical protein